MPTNMKALRTRQYKINHQHIGSSKYKAFMYIQSDINPIFKKYNLNQLSFFPSLDFELVSCSTGSGLSS